MPSKRTKALAISQKVKKIVWERDHHRCIFCGSGYANPEAHYISRAYGGLGIEENILTVCRPCHEKMDHTSDREKMLFQAKVYLTRHYPNWNEEELKYNKYAN